MKRGGILILILFILPIISAVEFDMKSEFDSGETIMARVSGNFITPILKENIIFYRGHVKIPIDYDITKINGEYYIYALLTGKTQNNYSLVIKDVNYMNGATQMDEDIIKEFVITNKTADFSVKPGFVVTNEDFFIEVQNLQDSKIKINIDIDSRNLTFEDADEDFFTSLFGGDGGTSTPGDSISSVEIISGDIEKINFELNNINQPKLKTIILSTGNLVYEIPAYIYVNETKEEIEDSDFKFGSSGFSINMSTDHNTKRIISLINNGDSDIEDIILSLSDNLLPYATLSTYEINKLDSEESVKIEIFFESDSEVRNLEGSIRAKDSTNISAYSSIELNFIKDFIPKDDEDENVDDEVDFEKTCEESGGIICSESESCTNETVRVKDGRCCLALCEESEGPSSTGKIIGWTIVVMVVVFLIWFFKAKYKGAKRNPNLIESARGRR